MQQKKDPFRFLDTGEFLTLPERERAVYLARASQEIEVRQRVLREQMQQLKQTGDRNQ
jgi:hypothetical protein